MLYKDNWKFFYIKIIFFKAIFFGDGVIRDQAEAACNAEDNSGSHIVSIHSAAENSYVLSEFSLINKN